MREYAQTLFQGLLKVGKHKDKEDYPHLYRLQIHVLETAANLHAANKPVCEQILPSKDKI